MRESIKLIAVIVIAGVLGIKALDYGLFDTSIQTGSKSNFTNGQVQEIWRNICLGSGQCTEVPSLEVVDSEQVNAYATQKGFVIFKGMLAKLETDDELAMVLGHEMAHYLLGHVFGSEYPTTAEIRIMEMQADKYGAFLMQRAGYDICKGRELMAVLLKNYGDGMDWDHPDFAFRYNQLNVNCYGGL